MALMSESIMPNGVGHFSQESGNEGDLEDGEIFDDEEPFEEEQKEEEKMESKIDNLRTFPPERKTSTDRRSDRDRRIQKRRKRDEGGEDEFELKNKHRRCKDVDRIEDEVDENEMICMRGGNSPSQRQTESQWERYDSFDEDMEDVRAAAIGNQGGEIRDRRRRREGFNSNSRVVRRGRLLRGGLKRRGGRGERDFSICKYYLQGNCQRGNDCPYSHNTLPPKKMEVCKFYMMDCCAKKDKCTFMHGEYPCKYFHSGLKCYAGKKCKFSHGKISPHLKRVLQLGSPKEDFPGSRFGREKELSPHNERHCDRNDRHHDRHGDRNHRGPRNEDHKSHHEPHIEDMRGNHRTDLSDGGNSSRERIPPCRQDIDLRDKKLPHMVDLNVPHHESDLEDGARTPMPSSPQEPERGIEKEVEGTTEHKEVNETTEEHGDLLNELPKKQRELFLRIQNQQKSLEKIEGKIENDTKDDEYREENWYSSDEESSTNNHHSSNSNPLNTLLKNLSQKKEEDSRATPVLPDIDMNAVSKILSSVRETMQKKDSSPPVDIAAPKVEERIIRDPRLRGAAERKSSHTPTSEPIIPMSIDMDLRLSQMPSTSGDVDLRHLPFKPAPPHQAAKEIDASITSHPPLEWKLIPYPQYKPDYSSIKVQSQYMNDPRLRRYMNSPIQQQPTSVQIQPSIPPPMQSPMQSQQPPHPNYISRDPRARDKQVPLASDPRRKSVLLNSSQPQIHSRFDEPHVVPPMSMIGALRDSDFRFSMPIEGSNHGHHHHGPMNAPSYGPPMGYRHSDVDLRVNSHFSYK